MLRAATSHKRKVAGDLEPADLCGDESTELEFFGDGPAGDESDAEPSFDRGFDGLGGIEIHYRLEAFEFETAFLECGFDDAARAGALFAHEETAGENLLRREMLGVGIWRRDEDEFVAHEGLDVNSALAGRAFDESDGDFAIEQKFDDFFGVAAVERELHAGMLVEEGTDETRKNVLGDRGGDAESEIAGGLAVIGGQLLFGFSGQRRDLFGVAEEGRSLRGEGDAIRGAIEETNSEIVLEGLDLERDGRLGQKQMLGGFAEVEMLGYGAENFEAEILQLSHGDDYLLKRIWRRRKSPL